MPLGLGGLFPGAERSGGIPAELYTFQRGTTVWRYTTARETQTVNGHDYLPSSIERDVFEQKNDVSGTQVTVTVPLALAVAGAFVNPTSEKVACTIQRVQTAGSPVFPVFGGEVASVKFTGDVVELTVATIERAFKTPIPRVRVAKTCQWALFSPQCALNKDDYDLSTTISSVSGQTIIVGAVPSQTMVGGMIRLPSGRILFVAAQTSSTHLAVWGDVPSEATGGASVTLWPGCNKLFSTCESTYNNAKHFGGSPDLPKRNPATSTLN